MIAPRLRVLALPWFCSLFVACSEGDTPTPTGLGGSGPGTGGGSGLGGSVNGVGGSGTGGVAAGGKTGGTAGNAAASGGGSAGTTGGSPGTAGAGAGGTTGGRAGGMGGGGSGGLAGAAGGGASGATGTGASGAAGGGASGASGAAGGGAGGAVGGGGGGTAGAAGAAGGALSAIAQTIDGFRLDAPCMDANHFGSGKADNCDVLPSVDRQTYQRTIGGSNTTTYDVKLHIRGLTEPNIYAGGMLSTAQRFYIGGATTQTGYTAYSLTVADPPKVYFFNYNSSVGHFVFSLDYEVVIPMRGGTTITFDVNGQNSVPDGHGVSNRDRVVIEGVPPAPDPFNGQFVQFDVVDVTVHD
jgi:hypothetical protein